MGDRSEGLAWEPESAVAEVSEHAVREFREEPRPPGSSAANETGKDICGLIWRHLTTRDFSRLSGAYKRPEEPFGCASYRKVKDQGTGSTEIEQTKDEHHVKASANSRSNLICLRCEYRVNRFIPFLADVWQSTTFVAKPAHRTHIRFPRTYIQALTSHCFRHCYRLSACFRQRLLLLYHTFAKLS